MIDNVTKVTSSRFIIFSLFTFHLSYLYETATFHDAIELINCCLNACCFCLTKIRDGSVNIMKWF